MLSAMVWVEVAEGDSNALRVIGGSRAWSQESYWMGPLYQTGNALGTNVYLSPQADRNGSSPFSCALPLTIGILMILLLQLEAWVWNGFSLLFSLFSFLC
jgi:hypothetical protein